jgi:hypothetical protein
MTYQLLQRGHVSELKTQNQEMNPYCSPFEPSFHMYTFVSFYFNHSVKKVMKIHVAS